MAVLRYWNGTGWAPLTAGTGQPGPKGDTGATGATGAQGIQGVQGPTGSGGGWIVCTSTTRPASPADGVHIYETDTKLHYFANAGQWYLTGEQVVARVVSSGSPASITATIPVVANGWKLRMEWYATGTATPTDVLFRFNGDATAGNYTRQYLYGSSTSAAAASYTNETGFNAGSAYGTSYMHSYGVVEMVDVWQTFPGQAKNLLGRSYDVRNFTNGLLIHTGGMWAATVSPYRVATVALVALGGAWSYAALTCYASSTLG